MAYKYGNRSQLTFLPDCIEKYVSEEDPVRVYDAFVDALNPKELGIEIDENAVGNSWYDPVTMIKILVYGYSYGWRSSRKLERALHHNLSFIWLTGGLKPDHKTISNFRKEHKESLKKVLKQCARVCIKLGLIEGNTLFADGSKFRANAGKSQTKTLETWKKYQKHVETRIEQLLEECQKIDENEKESLVTINKELQSKKRLKNKIGQLLQEMQESPSPQKGEKKINGTDPDCDIMKSRQGSHAGYNSQIVTDDTHGLIVSTDVTTSKNDLNELSKQIEKADEILGKPCKNVCADAGYSSVDDIKTLLDQQKTVVVPNNKQAQKVPKEERFGKKAFSYNPETDTYTCPNGEKMYPGKYRDDRNRIQYRMKKPSACSSCVHFGACTSSRYGRRIYRLVNEKTKEILEKSYESKEGQQLYAKRKERVEHPFGHIKRNLGAGTFLLRGLEGVNAELSLLGTCFNITRMITIIGGVAPLIENLKYIR
jgi:transposase